MKCIKMTLDCQLPDGERGLSYGCPDCGAVWRYLWHDGKGAWSPVLETGGMLMLPDDVEGGEPGAVVPWP